MFNCAKGRVIELWANVQNGSPANAALVLIPIETSGLEADAALIDSLSVTELINGTTNEQTDMGRIVLSAAELAAITLEADMGNDRFEASLPQVTWSGATGNAISRIVVAYDPDNGTSTDAGIVPLTMFEAVATPDGNDLVLTPGVFFRAS